MKLVAVLANPALPHHGGRTRARIALAADIIGCDEVTIVNLFPIASQSSDSIATLGTAASSWLTARFDIERAIGVSDAVLFGYGTSSPTGAAGQHFRTQVA